MLNDLKKKICRANKMLQKRENRFTWCSVSGFDLSMGLFVVKPRGVPYDELQPELMIVMSMDGNKLEGRLSPARDAETHRAMYMTWAMSGLQIGAIVHTCSPCATAFAQAGLPLAPIGAKHAEYFYDTVPVTRFLTKEEVEGNYEYNLGELAAKTSVDPQKTPAVLLAGHGAAAWGTNVDKAVRRALVLEDLAYTSFMTRSLNPNVTELDGFLRDARYAYRQEPM
ncbi:MAG: class II aldolase/adducin family protein [Oscillospiraceae bacterium]|nr:class II aldolase/adducin family protein [Oscillospiraceae bacterium]